jgi:Peptidase U49
MAARQYAVYVEYGTWSRQLLDSLRERNETRSVELLEMAQAEVDRALGLQDQDPMFVVLQMLNEELDRTLESLGMNRAAAAGFVCCSVGAPVVNAWRTEFPDGSALVHLTGALDLVIREMAGLLALVWRRYLANMPFLLGRRDTEAPGRVLDEKSETYVFAALLRYRAIQQRVWGRPSGLVFMEPAETHYQLARIDAIRFILAHEYAHHVLGHRMGDPQLTPDEGSQRQELEADDLALDLVFAQEVSEHSVMSLGVFAAMMALRFADHGSFIRRPHTHPPIEERLEKLLSRSSVSARFVLSLCAEAFDQAVDAAIDPHSSLPTDAWERLLATPLVHLVEGDREEVDMMANVDRILTFSEEQIGNALNTIEDEVGIDLSSGFAALRRGELREALNSWNVAHQDIDRICDPTLELSYYQVHKAMIDTGLARRSDNILHTAILASLLWRRLLNG